MTYFWIKAALSGLLIALISDISRRSAGFGALVASLPLVSVIGMIWLWRDTADTARIADHAQATFWYVLPSLPMFLVTPALLRAGFGFWLSLALGCVLTVVLYALMVWLAPKVGIRL